jgi:hypothetical protein
MYVAPATLDSPTGRIYSLSDRTHLGAKSCIPGLRATNQRPLIRQYLFRGGDKPLHGGGQRLTDALNLLALGSG